MSSLSPHSHFDSEGGVLHGEVWPGEHYFVGVHVVWQILNGVFLCVGWWWYCFGGFLFNLSEALQEERFLLASRILNGEIVVSVVIPGTNLCS